MGCRISGQKGKAKQRESRKKRSSSNSCQSHQQSFDSKKHSEATIAELTSSTNCKARFEPLCNTNETGDKEIMTDSFLYDVNISCHEDKLDWVEKYLLPVLEVKLRLKCFLYERDRPAGFSPSQTIEESVKNSRRTIVCFSHEYVASSWKQYEVLMAHHVDPNGLKNRIIPIVLDDCQIPTKLSGFSSLQWPSDTMSEAKAKMRRQFFWIRLLRSLQVEESIATKSVTEKNMANNSVDPPSLTKVPSKRRSSHVKVS